jgi:hypothetical protein
MGDGVEGVARRCRRLMNMNMKLMSGLDRGRFSER